MTSFVQIVSCFLAIHTVIGSPIAEFSLKKNFDFHFKPLPFKPLYFIKEAWGPFGKFGVKHGIEKRDLDKIKPAEVETETIENRLPVEVPVMSSLGPFTFPQEGFGRVPVTQSPLGPSWFGQMTPSKALNPLPAPPPPEVVITPPPPKKEPVVGLNTNIARDELIDSYLKAVEREIPVVESEQKVLPPIELNTIEKPTAPKVEAPVTKEEDNPFVRGSRLALYFGNILLDILSRFVNRPAGPVKE